MNAAVLLVVMALLAGCSPGADQKPAVENPPEPSDQPGTATLAEVAGDVKVRLCQESDWRQAESGMALSTNDKVRTRRDGFATIRFAEGSVLKLEPESLVSVTDLRLVLRTQARRSTFTLVEGRLEAEMQGGAGRGADLKIRTPSAEVRALRREVSFQ